MVNPIARCYNWCIYKGFVSELSQQQMKACKPIITPLPVVVLMYLLSFGFVSLGVVLLAFSYKAQISKTYRYDNVCPIGGQCSIRFKLDDDLKEPVFLYYRMENYYQNFRSYVKSRNNNQLQGENANDYSKLSECTPKISVDDDDNKDAVFLPCGLIAWSFFNDTFDVRKDNSERTYLKQTTDGIAWDSDKRRLFHDPGKHTDGVRIPGVVSFDYEPFIVWMKSAALPSFYKLAKIIEQDMDKGVYRMEINNNYDVSEFDGKKFFRFSTVTWLGGRNVFLGWMFLIIFGFLFIVATLIVIKMCIHPRRVGDASYLGWNKKKH